MSRLNLGFFYGRVHKAPRISYDEETGEYNYGMCYLDVVRGLRAVGDDVRFVKHDKLLIMSREQEMVENMRTWYDNSIIFVKGCISTKKMEKKSICDNPECLSPENWKAGNLVYITPIYVRKVRDYEDKDEAIEDIVSNREISNEIHVIGTVLRDPKIITTKKGVQFTQYPLAINRKFVIRTDDPSIRTDWPVVKSYGEQARSDKTYLKYQADVMIDGFLQGRVVARKCVCECCGNEYIWKDACMELVPYEGAVEYIAGHKSKEEVEKEQNCAVEDYYQKLYESKISDVIDDEELRSADVLEAEE